MLSTLRSIKESNIQELVRSDVQHLWAGEPRTGPFVSKFCFKVLVHCPTSFSYWFSLLSSLDLNPLNQNRHVMASTGRPLSRPATVLRRSPEDTSQVRLLISYYVLYTDAFKACFALSATDSWNAENNHFNYEVSHAQCVGCFEGTNDARWIVELVESVSISLLAYLDLLISS